MLKVKDAAVSASKWRDNAGRAADEFARNAAASADAWAKNTEGAKDTFRQAITAVGIADRFQAGVRRAGSAKFARKINDVAKDRFGPGVAAAVADYQADVAPYLQTIAGLTLSTRKPKGDPANYNRVQEVGKALNAKRMALLGSTGGGA